MPILSDVMKDISSLTESEKEHIFDFLKHLFLPSVSHKGVLIGELREHKFSHGLYCRHCGSVMVVRFGKQNGRQRYKCKDCMKISNDLTSSPLYRTKKIDKWINFIDCMLKGYSLRNTADIVEIHYTTAFYWRHKVLSAINKYLINKFEGIVEVDETYFLESRKGGKKITDRNPRKRGGSSTMRGISNEQACVLVARDRNKNTRSKLVGMGRITTDEIDQNLSPLLSDDNILCTDAHQSYKSYAKNGSIEHIVINGQKKQHLVKGIYHINNINNYHSRLKKWISRFNGISTKYLQLYLTWFQFLEQKEMEADLSKKKLMLFLACYLGTEETNSSLRLRNTCFN